jgi:sortase A
MCNQIRKGLSGCLLFGGTLLILAALALLLYDMHDDQRAGLAAEEVVKELTQQTDENSLLAADNSDEDETGFAALASKDALDPDREMPVVYIDGNAYVGRIDIPALNISLPVMNEWSYPNLKLAPCRYTGSIYQDNMVIAAHNYASFFGQLKDLSAGSPIIFTDAEGNEYDYVIAEITQLSPWEVEEMTAGEYPLTLFTCNYSGQQRVTVRCAKAETDAA